jgi:hypothetical protein
MTPADRLFELLPLIYRQRDAENGGALRALVRVLEEQWAAVEDEIGQMYRNWFIETCSDWAVPYIGDLIGYPMPQIPLDRGSRAAGELTRVLAPRREVANTIRYRRRRGTLALLEELARDIAGWPARAVEFDRLVSHAASLNHAREGRGGTVDLRRGDALDVLGSAFDRLSHTADLRRPGSVYSTGTYNLSDVVLFIPRLRSYSVTEGEAFRVEEAGDGCFSFSALGNAAPLFHHPEPEPHAAHIAGELNLPGPIRRRAFEQRVVESGVERREASPAYYGKGKSVAIRAHGWGRIDDEDPVPRERIVPADLTGWQYRPKPGHIAVDPVLGRLAFAPGDEPQADVIVSYYYGCPASLGGGEYRRDVASPADARIYQVTSGGKEDFHRLEKGLSEWRAEQPPHGIIEIADSQVYTMPKFALEIAAGQHLEIRAAEGCRPVLRLIDLRAGRGDAMTVAGKVHSRLTLNGLIVTGRALQVREDLAELTIRHCTLVPGWSLNHDCRPRQPQEPSLVLAETGVHVRIENSILGAIEVIPENARSEPNRIVVENSVVDSTSRHGMAIRAPNSQFANVDLTIRRSTVLGGTAVHQLTLGEDCIFSAPVQVARRQTGCVRYSYVPPGSRTPTQYRCQPSEATRSLSADEARAVQSTLFPVFRSTRYGSPDYCQLDASCPVEIRQGAGDESEMGVFHDLYEPQRYRNLLSRLQDFVPAGYDAGIIFTT